MESNVKVANVSLIGNKHRHRGVECEDNSKAVTENGVSVVCVSDGAGGQAYTHAKYGSKAVVDAICEVMTQHFDALYNENREAAVKSLLVAAVHVKMADLIAEHKLDSLERLSATMLFCAVKDRRMIVGHIGDGLICKVTSSGVYPITMPQNGEESSSTYFVTANHATDFFRLFKTTTDDCHAICLMTDGATDQLYIENSAVVRKVVVKLADILTATRDEAENELKSVVNEYIVNASNNSDDVSVGILYFDGTKSPDVEMLNDEGYETFPRVNDTFRELQEEMLPQVKKAKQIIVDAKSNQPAQNYTEREMLSKNSSTVQADLVDNKLDMKNFRYVNRYKMYVLYTIIVLLLLAVIVVSIIGFLF